MFVTLVTLAALAADPPAPAKVVAAPGKGVTITSGDDRFSVTLRTRFQIREAIDAAAAADDGTRAVTMATQVPTARLWFGGHVLDERVNYVFQLAVAPRDFRDGATSPIFDAYLDLTPSRDLSFRVGQIFVPFDRLRTIKEYALQFPDRPRGISEFSLDRDIGVYAYSDHLGGDKSPVAYRVGVFGGSGIHQLVNHVPGGLVMGRLELRPLGPIDDTIEGDLTRREAPALALGVGAAYNLNTTRARSTTSTAWTGGTADYLQFAGDAVFKWRGVGLEGEVLYRDAADEEIPVKNADGSDGTAYARSGIGVITQASVMLSKKTEIATRYGQLQAFDGTDPAYVSDADSHHEVGASLNWYGNGHLFKVQASTIAFIARDGTVGEINGRVIFDATF